MEGKYLFGCVCIITLGCIQIGAFALGIDGQVLSFTTTAIGGIIAFLLGLNITSPAQKTALKTAIDEIIEKTTKPKQ